ncbi:hypothetical protein EJB05_19543, partial [Eragrostis curvula]
MKQPVVLLLLTIAIAPVLAMGSPSAINMTCALITTPTRDFCAGFLSGDPAAVAATDARGVATAVVNTTANKAASTMRVITDLVDELSTCRMYYTTMAQSLSSVLVDFRAKRIDNATLEKAHQAMNQPKNCDTLLLEGKAQKNPFSKENGENDSLVRLAAAITSLLASKRIG